MESAVQLRPRYVVFDLSPGAGLRCFSPPAPAVEHDGVPLRTVALGLEALRRTRLSRADDPTTAHRPAQKVIAGDDHAHISSDPDTVSDAGTSGVHQTAEESDDDEEAGSFGELFFEEGFARKVGALAELVGMKGAYKPAAVLGEVVRLLQATGRREGCVRARTAV
ncbi:hypothetical protein PAHAL_5G207900 [Panicum hallii]|jgi:hypothetical protein|uniref:Uncharacterized protein n=1 Tax=Panicum hallii TaxID=206008 RepID=A0A2S3HT04_9POAL|nr:uncharacterized protein LOC112895723 [Panicum hallii]PAN29199.1 hypothetical protein PAHAL_5G207900 [Panicum hallii]